MRFSKIIFGIVICFMLITAKGQALPGHLDSRDSFRERVEDVRNLSRDISTINLLNGLHLSRDQMEQVLAIAQKARMKRLEVMNTPEISAVIEETFAAYQALRFEIQKGNPARGEVPKRAQGMKHRLMEIEDRVNRELTGEYNRLEAELKKVFTPEQMAVIETFQPCLIPPKDLNHPVRAGQADSNEGLIRLLRRLREVPEDIWNLRRDRFVGRHLDRIEKKKFKMTAEERQAEKGRIVALMEKARSLSDTDFEMEKENLATQIKPENKIDSLRDQIEQRIPKIRRPRKSRLGRFFLNDSIIPIIKERLATENIARK